MADDEARVDVRISRRACTLGENSYKLRAVIDTESVRVRRQQMYVGEETGGKICQARKGERERYRKQTQKGEQINESLNVIVTEKLFNPSYPLTSARGAHS